MDVLLPSAVLQRRPMTSQCLTSAFLFGASDVVAQQIIEKRGHKHDVSKDEFQCVADALTIDCVCLMG